MITTLRPRIRPALTVTLLACAGTSYGQPAADCTQINMPADSSYAFTDFTQRWRERESYNINGDSRRVRSVSINTLPVFDESNPLEDRWLYRLVNDLHANTREDVIADQLLFGEGMLVAPHTLAESERILRSRKYVGDARIRVLQECGEDVDLEVVTREVWTLSPEISVKSTGGHASTGFGLRDSNILGSGQLLDFHFKHDQERSSYGIGFKNPNINGSRRTFESEFATNSDGHRYYLQGGRPFYALDDPHSWQASFESKREVLNQYDFGERVSALQHDLVGAEFGYGLSTGIRDGHVMRYSGGLHLEEHDYAPVAGRPVPATYRSTLGLDYPFVQYELIDDSYVTGFNIGQIARTEDVHLGRQLRSRLGYAPGAEGFVIANGEYADMLFYSAQAFLQFYGSWDGRWNLQSSHWGDTRLHAGLEYHLAQGDKRVLFLGLDANKALNLQNGTQLVLGGSNGLRGYDTHFLHGDGSVRFTAEERYYTDYHLLQLARVGFAAFVDVGRVFGSTDPVAGKTYADVGFGLRLAPSKSESGQIIHLDLAWPVHSDFPGKSGPQFMVEVRKTF